jgi:2-polyprenyl-3-methyl-5-hydroxy-6-metoxy-1,4-benzoquinol methylase
MVSAALQSTVTPGPASAVVVWEETHCLLCGGTQSTAVKDVPEVVHGDGRCGVVVCRECGLTYTNPRPNAATIHRFYENYSPHQSCGLAPRDSSRAAARGSRRNPWKPYHPQKHGLPLVGQGRLLDFGCGGGAFLQLMHSQGWQVVGMDTCAEVANQIRTRLHLRALVGTLPHSELSPESFDAVSMWHSLEHVHEPMEVLRHAWRILATGGKLVIGVPNVGSAPRRWFGRAWYGWSLPHHLTHFTPTTLQSMVRAAGFHVERVLLPGNVFWLRESAAAACRSGRGGWSRWMANRFLSRQGANCLGMLRYSDELVLIAGRP